MNVLDNTPTAYPLVYRSYMRINDDGTRETWKQGVTRSVNGLAKIGQLTESQRELVLDQVLKVHSLPAGRALWVAGTSWVEHPDNFSGLFNCTSLNLQPHHHDSCPWETFWHLMNLGMQGCGVGLVAEKHRVDLFPAIQNSITLTIDDRFGFTEKSQRQTETTVTDDVMIVGDSRNGWAESLRMLLLMASQQGTGHINLKIDLTHVRASGERLNGFGGVANPNKLPDMFRRVVNTLNHAKGRKLTPLEAILIANAGAAAVVAGNVRRFAGMVQWSSDDDEVVEWLGCSAISSKDNLWKQDDDGHWSIDETRDNLRVANHTRIFHHKPTKEECIESVRKQFYSGEGAIQWAGEAVARANADLVGKKSRQRFFDAHEQGYTKDVLSTLNKEPIPSEELQHRVDRYALNPCAEVIGSEFHCNLSTVSLNLIDPADISAQINAFKASALSAVALLNRKFSHPRYQYSRDLDPIVLVSFTGCFDFFVNAFGVDWLKWWEAGRPENSKGKAFKRSERKFFKLWRKVVEQTIEQYCKDHDLKQPNRCTGLKPEGSLSLLSGASPGWHPPKSARFIRRITFGKNDPIALACMDYGYTIVPSQSDKDENGKLLTDPFDERCTEWLVEIPVAVNWADMPGADEIHLEKFSALAQFDFWMQVQRHYSTFNTSATIELRENEIEAVGKRIYKAIQGDEGYISTALLARFDDTETFPRLPFEPISRDEYQRLHEAVLNRRKSDDFHALLAQYDTPSIDSSEVGPAGCDSDQCLLPSKR